MKGLQSLFCLIPFEASAAEVLQVRSSSLLEIGDRNRTYTVKLSCVDIDPKNEIEARDWLKSQLPRRKRVNLRPEGMRDNVLFARVVPFGTEKELGLGLVDAGLASFTC